MALRLVEYDDIKTPLVHSSVIYSQDCIYLLSNIYLTQLQAHLAADIINTENDRAIFKVNH